MIHGDQRNLWRQVKMSWAQKPAVHTDVLKTPDRVNVGVANNTLPKSDSNSRGGVTSKVCEVSRFTWSVCGRLSH